MREFKFKAEWTMYLIFFIISSFISIPSIIFFIKDNSNYLMLVVASFVYGFVYFWISSFELGIKEGKVFYNSLFNKKEEFISNVKKLELTIGINASNSTGAKRTGFYNLDIISDKKVISVNIKPFSKLALITFIKNITEINPNIELDELSTSLKNANFKPVVNAGIKKVWQIALLIIGMAIIRIVVKLLLK